MIVEVSRQLLDVLIASLWQGACIAVIGGVVVAVAGRRLNAASRCAILQGALYTIVALPIVSVLVHLSSFAAPSVPMMSSSFVHGSVTQSAHMVMPVSQIDIISNDNLILILATIWASGVVVFMLRVVGGALQLGRCLRRSELLEYHDGVALYESPDVTVPFSCGLFKPAIIVPRDLAATRGPEYYCILEHELAHVRRHDAWSNLLDRVAHALLYYNPAVLLLMRAIAFEREAACDDLAVSESRDLDTYTRSLASFALHGPACAAVAPWGAMGFGRSTRGRIARLIDERRNAGVNLARYTFGGFIAVLLVIALSLALVAPTIALAGDGPVALTAVGAGSCPRVVAGPRLPKMMPPGLKSELEVRVSSAGAIATPVLKKSSGNASFDRASLSGAFDLMVAAGKIRPPNCTTPEPGTYQISLQSLDSLRPNHQRAYRWTVQSDHMKKPIKFGLLHVPGLRVSA